MTLSKIQVRSLATSAVVALAVFVGFRLLPVGSSLSHLDFRPGGTSVEMCDPANPQFLPVVSVRSPVTLSVETTAMDVGREATLAFRLVSASGKAIGPEDLAVTHTRRLHLLVISPDLSDYRHLHPEPAEEKGVWRTKFTPAASGSYRVFADFTPIATGRGLYGFAELLASGDRAVENRGDPTRGDAAAVALRVPVGGVRVNRRADLELRFSPELGPSLEKTMDAYAHLVAFDLQRMGYAHLHPIDNDPAWRPDPREPVLRFAVTFPVTGHFVVWAQYRVSGQERYRRFEIDVVP